MIKWIWEKIFGKGKEDKIILIGCEHNCPKSNKCPKWVVLSQTVFYKDKGPDVKEEGRCAIAWIPTLLCELKNKIGK